MSQAKELNLLEGSLWDKMIIIALPLAFTGVLQQLFNAADVAVLGHYVSSDAMAAVGNNVPVIGLIVSLCMGLALGVNVVTARYLGMRQKELASESVHTAFALSVAFGVAIALLGEIFCGFIMDVLDVPESVQRFLILPETSFLFWSAACRPGAWRLRRRLPTLWPPPFLWSASCGAMMN